MKRTVYAITDLAIEYVEVTTLRPHPDNPRVHPKSQIRQIAVSIKAFGFRMPIVIDADRRLICGHARVEASKLIGLTRIPAVRVTDLSEAQVRGLMIADNRLTEISTWDDALLAQNLTILSDSDLDFDIETIGFEYGEIEQRILGLEGELGADEALEGDEVPDTHAVPLVTRSGDLWILGEGERAHRIICGDSTDPGLYPRLLTGRYAAMVFTDPPYNLSARSIGQVCATDHGDFAMGSGEMSREQFTSFLGTVMARLREVSEPGSIHYLFMDWRHAGEILAAGREHYAELKNLCIWVKDRPGMGTFYRSQHELIFVFKHGDANHHNHFGLGEHGRTRSNVWCYPSARSFDAADGDPEGNEALKLHPTIKPVRLIADAILDCSRRGEIVLDPFLGSGSTLIACEKTQRVCAGIELSPRYIDVVIARWERLAGAHAVHEETGMSFDELAEARAAEEMSND